MASTQIKPGYTIRKATGRDGQILLKLAPLNVDGL
jgi:hypothetical protein